ncbi:MAG: hypothetical protein ACREFR_13770 [Limisphaerales bacterium]
MKTSVNAVLSGMILATVLTSGARSDAKVITAASCAFADVNNAVAQASAGDVVQLPPGTNWWSQTLNLYGVSLVGSGTNSTVLIDEENRSVSAQMINLHAEAGHFTEICDIQFEGGVTNTSINYYGAIAVYGSSGSSWRIDHNAFNLLYAKNICTEGNSWSCIDNNTFYERTISVEDNSYLAVDPANLSIADTEGDGSWASPPTYGLNSTNVLYVENNYFTNETAYVASVGACDGEGGARIVFRHNTVMNDMFNNHGTETGGRNRSERSFEIYDNTFICSPSAAFYPLFSAAMIRGGSGVIFSNTLSGYTSLATLRNYRYNYAYCGTWYPFCGANGTNSWDSNSPTIYLTGTSAGPNGANYLQVSGANWTPNQWVGYTVMDMSNQEFSVVVSNNVNTIYYMGGAGSTPSIVPAVATFNNGDPFRICLVYAALDQPGRGSGDLLVDDGQNPVTGNLITIDTVTGLSAWPREVLEPIYTWGNTSNGGPIELTSDYPTLQLNRDFYNETPKPGYTPYPYPSPLESETFATNGITGGGGGSTNGPPSTNGPGPLPPTHIHQINNP